MRILLVNDDGFGEPGLLALEENLMNHETWTVAPHRHHSGAGMSLNLYSPLVVHRNGDNRFSVEGTPVDCVKLALWELIPGGPPDLVISGINPGANVANNTWYSGTVAAATEAAFWNVPSMAVSQEYTSKPDFSAAVSVVKRIMDENLHSGIRPGTLLNVNVPCGRINGYRFTRTGNFSREVPFSRESDSSFRYGPYEMQPVREKDGTDVHALMDSCVSLSILTATRQNPPEDNGIESWCSRQF